MSELGDRARELAAAFDAAFAKPLAPRGATQTRLLALRCGGQRLAVDLREVSRLARPRSVTALPRAAEGVLGIVSGVGAPVVLWDLAVLLGETPLGPEIPWYLVCAADPTVGLAFEAFDGPRRAAPEEIAELPPEAGAIHARRVLSRGSRRPIVLVASVLDAVRARIGVPPSRSEVPWTG